LLNHNTKITKSLKHSQIIIILHQNIKEFIIIDVEKSLNTQ